MTINALISCDIDDEAAPRRWKRPARTNAKRDAIRTSAGYRRRRTHNRES